MKKPVESYDGYNLPITKQCIESLSDSILNLSYIYLNRSDMPQPWDDNINDIGIILSGLIPFNNIPGNITSAGLIYFKGELFPFKSGTPQSTFSIIDEPITVEGPDLNGMPYKGTYNNKYCKYDAAGTYSMNILYRAEIADRRPLFDVSFPYMQLNYLNENFTRQQSHQARSIFVIDQFGKLINNQIITPTIELILGTDDIEMMTLPAGYRPKVASGFDRLYFTAYVKRVGTSPVRTYQLPIYIVPYTGKIFLQTEGNSFNIEEHDLIYINIEYYVR